MIGGAAAYPTFTPATTATLPPVGRVSVQGLTVKEAPNTPLPSVTKTPVTEDPPPQYSSRSTSPEGGVSTYSEPDYASVQERQSRDGEQPADQGQGEDNRDERDADSATRSAGEERPSATNTEESSATEEALLRQQINALVSRDREVRDHEAAHAAVGGIHAGAPNFQYERGPDGKSYAVGGEVSIDVSRVPNDAEATLRKMDIVRRAALAPAEPSSQDLRVAARASQEILQAQVEIAAENRIEASGVTRTDDREPMLFERLRQRLEVRLQTEENLSRDPRGGHVDLVA